MYWLRRIPAETRIVVLVVFLALFQAILLSVFGLGAISRERRDVADRLRERARDFLQQYVADRCEATLRAQAERAFRAAFDARDPEWARDGEASSGGLFLDAYLVHPDGRIETPDELPLWHPPEIVDLTQTVARERSDGLRQAYRSHGFSAAEKAEQHRRFARDFPFARDELDRSLALLHAVTPPLLAPEAKPSLTALLEMRWIGVLNRVAGYLDAAEVEAYLARIDALGGPGFAAARDAQEHRALVLKEIIGERKHLRTGEAPFLHRDRRSAPQVRFYVRAVGSEGDLQVLAVDPAGLQRLTNRIVDESRVRSPQGVAAEIVRASARPKADVSLPVGTLPGYYATARISEDEVRERASDNERFYWYIIGFSVAGILAGGLLTARAVMREMKLAKLKAGFVSNVSHGLKTPLTSIRMFSEMLRSGKVRDEAERKECLDVIAQETERLGHLIQQVLDFGRLEARRRPFHWKVGPIEPILMSEAERFRRSTGLDESSFEVSIGGLPPVNHDPEAFSEVVANLLSNAYKYTAAEGRRIRLAAGLRGGRVVVAVEDNGPGVPVGERRKIFEQFYRANDLLTSGVEGTGLGLSIARFIVRAHGGRILVEDGALGGSRFVVMLPVAGARAPAMAEAGR